MDVPVPVPVTIPVPDPTVATPRLPDVHTPPPGASLSTVEDPAQTTAAPLTDSGVIFTVSTVATPQPAFV